MLNESSISQARTAILSHNESVKQAFHDRTEDGLFAAVGDMADEYEKDLSHYLWATNDRDEALRIAKTRRIHKGYEILVESKRLLD